jgi:hypothetical protein
VGTNMLDPLSACVKVADCCDPFSTGILTHVKSLETFGEDVSEQFIIADYFFFFWRGRLG